jgi:hypothetical protein
MPPEAKIIASNVSEIRIKDSEFASTASPTGLEVALIPFQIAPPPVIEGALPGFRRFSIVLRAEPRG